MPAGGEKAARFTTIDLSINHDITTTQALASRPAPEPLGKEFRHPLVPAPLHPYLEQCHFRARELNAIEAVFRYAACRIEMYLKHGTVTLGGCTPARRGVGRQAVVAKQ
jgi:hypothetical protein